MILSQGYALGRLFILSWLVLLAGWPVRAAAQGAITWSEPLNVSISRTSSAHPAIVADAYGFVHVFWSEEMDGRQIASDELPEPPNTILYRRGDGQEWTEPLDILAVVGDPLADFVAATVDDMNQLHLVWTGLTNLYYSSAPAAEAYSVRAWSAPQMISRDSARSRYESDVAVDSQGNVHIVYATRGSAPGVFHIEAPAGTAVWSMPVRIADNLRANETVFKDVRLVIDASDRLHAVWATSNQNGYSQAVYYAGNDRLAATWDPPVLLADATIETGFTGWPYLLAHGQDQLMVIHVDQGNRGRIERTSVDAGKTWSEPHFILSSMEGVNGFLIPLVDGIGNLHLVINMRPTADQRVGIYYAPRAGLDWAPIIPVAVEAPYGPTAHYTDAAVRLGNEIYIVWTQLHGGEIWYVRGQIAGVPEGQALVPPTPTAMPTTAAVATALNVEPTATASAAMPTGSAPTSPSSFQPLLFGGLASALIVLVAVLWARARSR